MGRAKINIIVEPSITYHLKKKNPTGIYNESQKVMNMKFLYQQYI